MIAFPRKPSPEHRGDRAASGEQRWPSLEGIASTRSRVRSSDGTDLHVEVFGRGGPTILLQNGICCSTDYFVPAIVHFAPRCRVVAWDYPSHGRSGEVGDPRALGIARLGADAERVLDAVGGRPAIVVGHSMGVRVALELSHRAAERIDGVVLLCGSVDGALGARLAQFEGVFARALEAGVKFPGAADRLKTLATRTRLIPELAYRFGGMCRERTPREPVDALIRNIRRMDVAVLLHLARSYMEHCGRGLLAEVRAPTLVIAGERDGLAPPEHCLGVVQALPDAELWVAPGCTHLALVEDPTAVNAQIARFIERVAVDHTPDARSAQR